jgi:tryptophan 2,3-dioxygenase
MTSPSDPWWRFDLAPDTRADGDANRLRDPDGQPLVNAPGPDGRLALDYAAYLRLDDLLGAQRPASTVPDERVFVIVHQLSELVFKQMAFDLTVVTATFERLLGIGGREGPAALHALALAEGEVDDARSEAAAFWRPAITASNRLRHAARRILPAVMELMGRNGDNDVLFSTLEFAAFRGHLEPSSGFQTAQLRLLQRALGKGPLLDVRVFPGDKFGRHYTGAPCAHVALADPLILRADRERAVPDAAHPSARAAALDAVAHALLAQLPPLGAEAPPPPAVRTIHADEVTRAVDRFRATLGLAAGATPAEADAATERFAADLTAAADAENTRRAALGSARAGAYALQVRAPRSALAHVLSRIVALDDALHATQPESFLSVHRATVRRHVHDEGGTGGGGMPYLVTSQRYLFPLFPALVAYQDLDDPVA